MHITRREALGRISAGTLMAMGLWPGALNARDQRDSGSFRFLVINDTHYMSPECGEWLDGVVRQMKTHGTVDFCLLAGDLTEHGKREDLAAVREVFKGLEVPVYVQIGNHDYVSQTDRRAYEKLFRRRLNYYFTNGGWQFVGLDSTEGILYQNTQIQSDTFVWVRDNIRKLDKKKPLVIFTHFPLGNAVNYRPGQHRSAPGLSSASIISRPSSPDTGMASPNDAWARPPLPRTSAAHLKRTNHDGTKKKGYFLCTAKDGQVIREFIEYKGKAVVKSTS